MIKLQAPSGILLRAIAGTYLPATGGTHLSATGGTPRASRAFLVINCHHLSMVRTDVALLMEKFPNLSSAVCPRRSGAFWL